MKLKDILKVAAPVVLGPAVGGMFPGMNPILSSALASGIGASVFGQKPKDALRAAVLGGLGGAMFGGPQQTTMQTAATSNVDGRLSKPGFTKAAVEGLRNPPAGTGTAKGIGSVIGRGGAPLETGKLTMSGELLRSLDFAGPEKGNLLFRLLNTNLGEGLAAGLVAQLLAGGDEEDGPAPGSYERRPFGAGGPGGQLGGIQYAKGGLAEMPDFYPRRTGGIDPSEGSGTKDDVPALLLAGEFVHTRDANEGLGKMMGAKNKDEAARMGIEAQYQLMDAFERMA